MPTIAYKTTTANGGMIRVTLDGRSVGLIRPHGAGYHYKPNGGLAGDTFATIAEVKKSLEA